MEKRYNLIDGIERNNQNPDTFGIPTPYEKSKVKLGNYVKVGFEYTEVEAGNPGGERMWVEVTKIEEDNLTGKLNSLPLNKKMKTGETVKFNYKNIIDIWENK